MTKTLLVHPRGRKIRRQRRRKPQRRKKTPVKKKQKREAAALPPMVVRSLKDMLSDVQSTSMQST